MGLLDVPAASAAVVSRAVNNASRSAASLFRGMVPCVRRGTNLGYGTYSNGVATSGMYRKAHFVLFDIADIRLVYSNYGGDQGSPVTDSPNPITVKASVEIPVAATQAAMSETIAVTFNGAPTYTIPPGGTVVSDPIPLTAYKGQVVYSNTYVSVASAGMKWPVGDMLLVNGLTISLSEGGAVGAPASDTTAGPTPPTGYLPGYGPVTIIGNPAAGVVRPVSIFAIGDSILYGAADYTPRWEGWLGRAAELAGVPVINTGHPGDRASYVGGTGLKQRLPLIGSCDVMISNYGTNDFNAGALTFAQAQPHIINVWRAGFARGTRVYQTTLGPWVSSTDDFATVANQVLTTTPTDTSAKMAAFNAWLFDGAPLNFPAYTAAAVGASGSGVIRIGSTNHPLAGIIDLISILESSPGSGKWKVGRTVTDGVITSGSRTVTSASANFTTAEVAARQNIVIQGLNGGSTMVLARLDTRASASSINYDGTSPATQSATGQKLVIGGYTADGGHPSIRAHQEIAAVMAAILPTL